MAKKDKSARKKFRTQIVSRLESTFSDLQNSLGKTRFKRNIKKAAKALITDFKDVSPKTNKQAKKARAPRKTTKLAVPEISQIV
jgi:hypothetical protein